MTGTIAQETAKPQSRPTARLERCFDAVMRGLRSPWALIIVLAFFVLNGIWVALTAQYSLLYDEQWHFNIIRVYAEAPWPVFVDAHAPMWLGSQERAGSFLFHVLMSWPERLLQILGVDLYHRLLVLRVLCVLMYAAALAVLYTAAVRLRMGKGVALAAVVMLAAIPLSTFLAATVNYDNMLLLSQACLLLGVVEMIRAPRPSWALAMMVAGLGAATLLIKFTAAPVVGLLGVVGLFHFVRGWVQHGVPPLAASRGGRRIASLAVAAVTLVGGVVMVVERYVQNYREYGSAVPDCDVIAPRERCEAYGPWQRNEVIDDLFEDIPTSISNAFWYFGNEWWPLILERFALVRMPYSEPVVYTVQWFILPSLILGIVAIASALWFVVRQRNSMLVFLATAFGMTAVMFWYNFTEYARFGEPIAVQSRYLLFPLALVVLVAFQAIATSVRRAVKRATPALVAGFVFMTLLFGQGGWASAYIIGQGDGWIHVRSPLHDVVVQVMLFVSAFTFDIPVQTWSVYGG